jgi:predicted ATP-grasp superfamily ATP-dependent carboligase
MDFMIDGNTCRVLEVNPRPSATAALYDADFDEGLLASHIRAVRGRLGSGSSVKGPVRAFRVALAGDDFVVPPMNWPEWCSDLPLAGTVLQAGCPICTISAESGSRAATLRLLRERADELFQRLRWAMS